MQGAWIPVAKVAEEVRLDVAFREEFLIAAETWFAGGKELLVHLAVIEAGHGSAIETERARSHHQVCALQTGIALCSRFHHVWTALKELRHPGVLRE